MKRVNVNIRNRVKDKHCTHCSFATTTPTKLNLHIKTVHDKIKDFECDICGKVFEYKRNMEGHIKTVHNKIEDFECDICGKAFGRKKDVLIMLSQNNVGVYFVGKYRMCL